MRKTPLKKVSKKRQREMPNMRKWHDEVVERDGTWCVIFPRRWACVVHHIRGRLVRPDLIFDVKNGLHLSKAGHSWFHDNPKEAKEWLRINRSEQYKYLYEETG